MTLTVSLDALYEAALLTDGDFKITDCNDRAVEVLRTGTREQLIGRRLVDIPSDYALGAEFPTYLRERLTAVPFVVTEYRVTRDDNSIFWAESVAHRLSENAHLITLRDVTARVESLHRAEEANERLRAAIRDRMEFVSNVSHELRTPLTSMSYALTNMQRGICGTLPEKAVGYLERLHVDVKRLMTTVNDLLDLRQMENGSLKLRCTRIPLLHLINDVAQSLMIQAEIKHQTLTVESSDREYYIHADRHKIERVFFNVFSNAIKYTPENGAITARIHLNGNRVLAEVDDTGVGIPPEALPRVSQRYFRVGDQVAGTGLGLSIVREITELHNGIFLVESPVPNTEGGTRISLDFPLEQPPTTMVISEDSAFYQQLTQALHTVVDIRSATLTEGLLAINHGKDDISHFVIDGAFPEAEIYDAICKLRRTPRFARTPVLLLTDATGPLLKRDCARWRVTVRPRSLSTIELQKLITDTEDMR